MASSSALLKHLDINPSSWTVEKLKEYLKNKGLPISGRKVELISTRVLDFLETEEVEQELEATGFRYLKAAQAPISSNY